MEKKLKLTLINELKLFFKQMSYV